MRIRLVARFGPPSSPLPPWVGYSTLAHVAFLAALIVMPSFRGRAPLVESSLLVDLVSAPRPAARVAAPPSPPAPPVEAAPPEGVRVETQPPPKPKPLPEKPPPKPKKEQPKPAAAPPPPPAPAGPAGPPGGPEGASISAVDAGDVEYAWYRASVTAALYSHWTRPILEGASGAYEVGVAFEIQRDGSVADLRVESPSGVPSLDRSALRAVADAAPLPPLPSAWRAAELPARYVFRLLPE
jgi:protein TonB